MAIEFISVTGTKRRNPNICAFRVRAASKNSAYKNDFVFYLTPQQYKDIGEPLYAAVGVDYKAKELYLTPSMSGFKVRRPKTGGNYYVSIPLVDKVHRFRKEPTSLIRKMPDLVRLEDGPALKVDASEVLYAVPEQMTLGV